MKTKLLKKARKLYSIVKYEYNPNIVAIDPGDRVINKVYPIYVLWLNSEDWIAYWSFDRKKVYTSLIQRVLTRYGDRRSLRSIERRSKKLW